VNTTPTDAMAITRAARPTPTETAAHVRRNGPIVAATASDGSALEPENSALNTPIPTAASHSGAIPVTRRSPRMLPSTLPATRVTRVTRTGGQTLSVNARPTSHASAMTSFVSGLDRPRTLPS
jgi:hypothetical protein